ncbi:MAG TPA: DUF6396 domain-containing protein, partial [Variovorax sp.]|nr:DUF6396 domain-containing protein [Variovorax sp.]
PPLFWGNRQIALKMLECAFAQGHGQAAYELGATLNVGEKDYARSLAVLHEGVKFGSQESAGYLSSSFRLGSALAGNAKDPSRADRYHTLANALYFNPDLRFPNLDKVLPLPPAALPKWDGNKQTLIDAAKQIVPAPAVQPTPGSQRTGRAHIPQGYALPRNPVVPASEWQERFDRLTAQVRPQPDGGTAPFSGYWLAQLTQSVREFQIEWNQRQVPLRYAQGERFDTPERKSLGEYAKVIAVQWHYMGEPLKLADAAPPVEVARGIARMSRLPMPLVICRGSNLCPRTGIWEPEVEDEHALANVFHDTNRQAYVEKGQPFPDPRDMYLDIEPHEVQWLWADNANGPAAVGKQVTLTDLHDEQGKPLA